MRKKMNNKKSKGLFKATAAKTKKVNVTPKVYRGGIRL